MVRFEIGRLFGDETSWKRNTLGFIVARSVGSSITFGFDRRTESILLGRHVVKIGLLGRQEVWNDDYCRFSGIFRVRGRRGWFFALYQSVRGNERYYSTVNDRRLEYFFRLGSLGIIHTGGPNRYDEYRYRREQWRLRCEYQTALFFLPFINTEEYLIFIQLCYSCDKTAMKKKQSYPVFAAESSIVLVVTIGLSGSYLTFGNEGGNVGSL